MKRQQNSRFNQGYNKGHGNRSWDNRPSAGKNIPSPYNFVPLSKKIVFFDDIFPTNGKVQLSKRISHDIPFKEGLSGEIDISITALSPIYIRNGGAWQDQDRLNMNSDMQNFFQFKDNSYYIPGTSVKGMTRAVYEIATFSKINANLVYDNRHSIRDLHNPVYTKNLTSKKGNVVSSLAQAGWLYKDNDDIKITPCDYARVEVMDLVKICNQPLNRKQSAVDKYSKWGSNLQVKFNFDEREYDHSSTNKWRGTNYLYLKYKKATLSENGKHQGTLVFTGQPSNYEPRDKRRKHMEFIFFNEGKNSIDVTKDQFKDFKFIHSDEKSEPNVEWAYWSKKLDNNQRVPVFYLLDKDKQLSSFGLAMMYRLPYKNTIHDMIKVTNEDHLNKSKIDMTEALFGFISDNDSLKGRVQFGHLKATSSPQQSNNICKTVLGGPKPTYYPNYLKQDANPQNYKTYMDKAEIRGRKRYPIEKIRENCHNLPNIPNDNDKVATMFKPLPKGSTFTGKIRYHNLLPLELGALLWSLTFGNNKNCKHNIGMAKPLGFGVIDLQINNQIENAEEHINNFKNKMKDFIGDDFDNSDPIKHLVAMAAISIKANYETRYPTLDRGNEFADFKRDKHILASYIK